VSQPNDDSLSGRGEDELLPEKGDPFEDSQPDPSPTDDENDDARWMGEIDRQLDAVMAEGGRGSFEPGSDRDHGMTAHEEEDFDRDVGLAIEPASLPEQSPSQIQDLPVSDEGQESEPGQEAGFSPEAEIAAIHSLDRRQKIVWRWADSLRGRIYKEVDNLKLARRMLDRLDHARKQLDSRQPDVVQAERLLGQIEYQLHLSRRVRKWSTTLGPRLLMYELVWLLVLFVGLLIMPGILSNLLSESTTTLSPAAIQIATRSALWGGIGGALAALLGLRRHMLQYQDFDRQWSLWYLANPVVGILLGTFVYLILRVGLSTLVPSTQGEIQSAWLAYFLGGLSGLQQSLVYDLAGRAVRWISPRKGAE
jgi:hypothetical protein